MAAVFLREFFTLGGPFSASWYRNLMWAVYGASGLVVGYAIFLVVQSPLYWRSLENPPQGAAAEVAEAVPEVKPLEVYRNILDQHPVFGAAKQETQTVAANPCDQFAATYALAGIVQGGENEALFNNRRTKETHFVKAGESIDQVTIHGIKPHGVIVTCGAAEKEIQLEEI